MTVSMWKESIPQSIPFGTRAIDKILEKAYNFM